MVCGATLERYEKNGGPFSVMGFPLSTEIINPDGVGTRTQFMGGSIYWHPDSGAHFVANAAMRIWERFGWEGGVLGYPSTEASSTTIPLAYKQTFSDKDMYYTEVLGGAVWGDIKAKYDSLGGPSHTLGIPTTAEQMNGEYRYTDFTNGTISWSPERQTRVLYGATRNEWARHGRETGSLGFPLNDEQAILPGLINKVPFATGSIIWSALFGAHYLPSEWELLWDSYKDTLSPLGLPMAWEHYGTEEQSLKLDNGYITLRGDSYGVLSNNPATPEAGILDDIDIASVTEKSITLDPGIASAATYSQRDQETKCEAWAEKIRENLSSYNIISSRRSRINSFDEGLKIPIRKGHYSWTADRGFGWMKSCKKHNLGDTRLIAEVIRGGDDFQTTASDQRGTKMRFDINTCRFARCTSNKQVEIRVAYYPKVADTWYGSASKAGPDDTSPVGLITGYCFGYNVCPEIVNGPRAIGLGPDPLE